MSKAAPLCIIIDSGLRNAGGHNLSYSLAVRNSLQQLGWRVSIWANRGCEVELLDRYGLLPVFHDSAYDYSSSTRLHRVLRRWSAQTARYLGDLHQWLSETEPPDLIFGHTIGDFELPGWTVAARWLPQRTHLGLLLRNTRGYLRMSRLKSVLHPFHAVRPLAAGLIAAQLGSRFTLFTDSEELSRDYRSVVSCPVVTLPIPVPNEILDSTCRNRPPEMTALQTGGIAAGYMGDARVSKGFDLLPGLVGRMLSSHPELNFVIQCPHPASGRAEVELPALVRLQEIALTCPERLCLIPRRLEGTEYAGLIGALDLVLLPYRREGYEEPTSGIFAEAVALAKPVICPAGTWMAAALKYAGAGVTFESGSLPSLVEATMALLGDRTAYFERAGRNCEAWRAEHNASSLTARLLTTFNLMQLRGREARADE